MLSCLLLSSSSVSAYTVVDVPNKHVSIQLPSSWEYARDVSYDGTMYDLEFTGPSSLGLNPHGVLTSWVWSGPVTNEALREEMQGYLDDIASDPVYTDFYLEYPVQNRSRNGVPAVDVMFSVAIGDPEEDGYYATERVMILASDVWGMAWLLNVSMISGLWMSSSITVKNIINSLSVDEKSSPDVIAPMVVGVCAVVAVAGILLWRRRGVKKTGLDRGETLNASSSDQSSVPPPRNR